MRKTSDIVVVLRIQGMVIGFGDFRRIMTLKTCVEYRMRTEEIRNTGRFAIWTLMSKLESRIVIRLTAIDEWEIKPGLQH